MGVEARSGAASTSRHQGAKRTLVQSIPAQIGRIARPVEASPRGGGALNGHLCSAFGLFDMRFRTPVSDMTIFFQAPMCSQKCGLGFVQRGYHIIFTTIMLAIGSIACSPADSHPVRVTVDASSRTYWRGTDNARRSPPRTSPYSMLRR